MLDNTKRTAGFSVVELMVVITVGSVVILLFFTIGLNYFSAILRSQKESIMVTESQRVLSTVVEALRTGAAIHETSENPDPHAPGGQWTTSDAALVIIVATPALDHNRQIIVNELTGYPYYDELVFYGKDGALYRRILANPNAPNNRLSSTCPPDTAGCRADAVLSREFKTMTFTFYDQDNALTASTAAARSVLIDIELEQTVFSHTVTVDNSIRVTMRNIES